MCQKLVDVFRSGSRSCAEQLHQNDADTDEIDLNKKATSLIIGKVLERLSRATLESREIEVWCLWETDLDIEPHIAHLPTHGTSGYDPFIRARALEQLSEPHFKKGGTGNLVCSFLRGEGFEVEVRYNNDSPRPFLLLNYWKIFAKW